MPFDFTNISNKYSRKDYAKNRNDERSAQIRRDRIKNNLGPVVNEKAVANENIAPKAQEGGTKRRRKRRRNNKTKKRRGL
jgi:hypothetical protein